MSEEEKKVISTVENFIKYYKKNEQTGNRANLDVLGEEAMAIEFILNKYDVQQKEINTLKEIEQQHKTDNGLLRQELDMQIEHNKELEEHQRQYLDGELITAKQGKFFEKMIKENYIRKDKLKEIVDEHIPKQPNIITGEIEYTPNANANSFLVQDILKLLEEK